MYQKVHWSAGLGEVDCPSVECDKYQAASVLTVITSVCLQRNFSRNYCCAGQPSISLPDSGDWPAVLVSSGTVGECCNEDPACRVSHCFISANSDSSTPTESTETLSVMNGLVQVINYSPSSHHLKSISKNENYID